MVTSIKPLRPMTIWPSSWEFSYCYHLCQAAIKCLIHLVNLWLHFKNVLKKSTVWDMKVTKWLWTSNAALAVCLFHTKVMFLLKILHYLFPFKVQVTRVLLYLHIQVHPTWEKLGCFPLYVSFWVNFYYTVHHGTSQIQHQFSTECCDLKLWRYCLFFWKMIFLWGGGGGGAAILRKLRRFLNQLSNHPCLNFLEMILLINVIVKVTPPPPHATGNC